MATPKQLRKAANDGLLYLEHPTALKLGSKSVYDDVRNHIEDVYDHEGAQAIKKAKPSDVPTENVKVHNYNKLYFVVDKQYRYMYVYLLRAY